MERTSNNASTFVTSNNSKIGSPQQLLNLSNHSRWYKQELLLNMIHHYSDTPGAEYKNNMAQLANKRITKSSDINRSYIYSYYIDQFLKSRHKPDKSSFLQQFPANYKDASKYFDEIAEGDGCQKSWFSKQQYDLTLLKQNLLKKVALLKQQDQINHTRRIAHSKSTLCSICMSISHAIAADGLGEFANFWRTQKQDYIDQYAIQLLDQDYFHLNLKNIFLGLKSRAELSADMKFVREFLLNLAIAYPKRLTWETAFTVLNFYQQNGEELPEIEQTLYEKILQLIAQGQLSIPVNAFKEYKITIDNDVISDPDHLIYKTLHSIVKAIKPGLGSVATVSYIMLSILQIQQNHNGQIENPEQEETLPTSILGLIIQQIIEIPYTILLTQLEQAKELNIESQYLYFREKCIEMIIKKLKNNDYSDLQLMKLFSVDKSELGTNLYQTIIDSNPTNTELKDLLMDLLMADNCRPGHIRVKDFLEKYRE